MEGMDNDFSQIVSRKHVWIVNKKSKEVWLVEFKMPSGNPVVKKLEIQHSVPICFNIMIIDWLFLELRMIQGTMDEWEPKGKTTQKDENINGRYVKKE